MCEEHGKTKHMQKQRHKQRQSTNMTLIKCLAHFNFISNLRMQMLSLPLCDYHWKFSCQHFFKPPWPPKLVSALSATLPFLSTIKNSTYTDRPEVRLPITCSWCLDHFLSLCYHPCTGDQGGVSPSHLQEILLVLSVVAAGVVGCPQHHLITTDGFLGTIYNQHRTHQYH